MERSFRLLLLLFFLLTYPFAGLAQNKQSYVVSHNHRFDENDPLIMDISNQLTDPDLVDFIESQTLKMIGRLTNGQVEYQELDSHFRVVISESSTNLPPAKQGVDFTARVSSEIRISGGQSYSRWGPNYINYIFYFSLRINDSDGEKFVRKTVKVPFQAIPAKYVYGPLISKQDIRELYLKCLAGIMNGQSRTEKITVQRGENALYDGFINNAREVLIRHNQESGLKYGERFVNGRHKLMTNKEEVIGVIKVSGSGAKKGGGATFGINLVDRIKQNTSINNQLTGEKIELEAEVRDAASPSLQILDPGGIKTYTLNSSGKVSIKDGSDTYEIIIKADNNLYEIFQDQKLVGLVQYGPIIPYSDVYLDHAFFNAELDNKMLGKLYNYYLYARILYFIQVKQWEQMEDDDE